MSGIQLLGGGVVPVGTIISYLGNNAPDGYLFCDGTEYNIGDYPALANHFETEFGTKNYFGGDGETTFKVPDLQGEFLRCTGTNPNTDQGSGGNVGVHQDATEHLYIKDGGWLISCYTFSAAKKVDTYVGNNGQGYEKSSNGSKYTGLTEAYTSRPTNTSVWYCIKY